MKKRTKLCSTIAVLVALAAVCTAQSEVVGWGQFRFDSAWSQGPFTRVRAGWGQSMAIRTDGSAVAWGMNWSGMCEVPTLPPGATYVAIDSGEDFTIALRSNGTVVAWGANTWGQCNVPPLPPGRTYVEIAAAWVSGLARRSDGVVVAWGANWWGECNVPALPPGSSYVEVAAGYDHCLARRSDGSVVAWGSNGFGQCNVPALPPGLTYTQVSTRGTNDTPYGVYASHSVALRSDGSAVAWGKNDFGQCTVPALPPGIHFVAIHGGGYHTLAQLSDGSVIAWGRNDRGQCDVPPPPAGSHYVAVSAGADHDLALLDNGEYVAWGGNDFFQCKMPRAPSGLSLVEVSSGGHALARLSDGSAIAWGSNNAGQCDMPAMPPGLTYTQVAAGGNDVKTNPTYWNGFSVALRSDGSLAVWGDNTFGQCNAPALPPGLTYVEVAAGNRHALARRSDGSVVAWGDNAWGQCNVPALPPGLAYVELAASYRNGAARRSDGSVVVWGDNSAGQCNVLPLPPGVSYVEVESGCQCTVARRSDGSVVAWGDNSLGQLNVPALPLGLTYVEISADAWYSGPPWNDIVSNTLARRSDGAIVVWGDTRRGQSDVPTLANGLSFEAISSSGLFTVALVSGPDCESPSVYGAGALNSTGEPAHIGYQGSASVAANDLVLLVDHCPPNTFGFFFVGSRSTRMPFMDGDVPAIANMIPLSGIVILDASGSGNYAIDFSDPSSPAFKIHPRSQRNFQFWYRDPMPGFHETNVSDLLHAYFCP